jgi:hypothetical protein
MFEFVLDFLPVVFEVMSSVSSVLDVFRPATETTNIAAGALLEIVTGSAETLGEVSGALVETSTGPSMEAAAGSISAMQ